MIGSFEAAHQKTMSKDGCQKIAMVATGQKMVKEKKFFNVREFYYGSGKIGILMKSQGKLKL